MEPARSEWNEKAAWSCCRRQLHMVKSAEPQSPATNLSLISHPSSGPNNETKTEDANLAPSQYPPWSAWLAPRNVIPVL